MQLTYNLRNFVGDGCTERYQSGLTYFGVRVVERMNKLGTLVDTGHCCYQTTLDAVEVSKVPIASTHTTCKSVYTHSRGETDEELKAIAIDRSPKMIARGHWHGSTGPTSLLASSPGATQTERSRALSEGTSSSSLRQ